MFMPNQSNQPFSYQQWFKRLSAAAAVLAVLLLNLSAASVAAGQGQAGDKSLPVFDINKTEHDFGDIFIGESVTIGLTVRNLGAAPLQLGDTPVITGKPTVGSYRQPLRHDPSSALRDLRRPAALGATPFT
jgi:hypothetical protein